MRLQDIVCKWSPVVVRQSSVHAALIPRLAAVSIDPVYRHSMRSQWRDSRANLLMPLGAPEVAVVLLPSSAMSLKIQIASIHCEAFYSRGLELFLINMKQNVFEFGYISTQMLE